MSQAAGLKPQAVEEPLSFAAAKEIIENQPVPALYEMAVKRGEGLIGEGGGIVVDTGEFTGRSPKDKHVVVSPTTEDAVWWENNNRISPEHFETLLADFQAHARGKTLFSQDLFGGADETYRLPVRVTTEYAWHALFIRHLLIRPDPAQLKGFAPEMQVVCFPSFRADPKRHGVRSETVIACDFDRQLVLIGGSEYAGEMKKSVFTMLNYILPAKGVLPMHCSANVGRGKHDAAIFFGLSGTGKTTLSTDPQRILIGDDEHGWSDTGLFNFEGGCYAKTIRLRREAEPEIYDATFRFGTVLENVVIDPETRRLDLDDDSKTENTRSAYPIDYIANASLDGKAPEPDNVIMLTADAFGVMPPVAKLDLDQAIYYFLLGYTAKVAGTERGLTEPEATFSACFGAPFLPRHPTIYGDLLKKKVSEHGSRCWLVNTGWTGGPFGVGKRISIKVTRAILHDIFSGKLAEGEFRQEPYFGLSVPKAVSGVEASVLDPRSTWPDKAKYDEQAAKLKGMFEEAYRTLGG
jgi:phosphoenolpyruvate carboxykinase (ATP)